MKRIPRLFYDDYVDRMLPAPPIVKRTSRSYWIDTEHPNTAELLDDARFCADKRYGPGGPWAASAKALLKALHGED